MFLGRWTQYLCAVTSVTQSKIFYAFGIFQKKLEPVKLATKFLGKESWNWLILFRERLKRPWFEELKVLLCSPARCVLCRRNLSVRAPRGPSDLKRSREFDQWYVLSRFHSQTYCWAGKVLCCFLFSKNFAYRERRVASEVQRYFRNRKRRILEIPREFRLQFACITACFYDLSCVLCFEALI